MTYIPYNSIYDYHKYPFGAVKENDEITFRIVLPRDICCRYATLVVSDDNKNIECFTMQWEKLEGNFEEWWQVKYKATNKGIYFYHFNLSCDNFEKYISKDKYSIGIISDIINDFQLTVYSSDYETPDDIKGGIIYQIFPDRFNFSGEIKKNIPKDRLIHYDLSEMPLWNPDKNGKIDKYDFYMGDFKGIELKLDYLKELNVNIIYLNPIFLAASNHRYDTADYEKTDILLGSEEDFISLCDKAHKKGIKIILDGVFSHTGADSKYFNKFSHFNEIGAYNSKNSKYYDWYKFKTWPDNYESWWGVDILPEIDEENSNYISYIKNILTKWQKNGADGWRLDVADELPDKFLFELRKTVKKINPNAYILGEVWEDASNKISYSKRREYLLGKQLDSVMNYPFAEIMIDFIIKENADNFNSKILEICENYPICSVHCLMNHIGTHDTCRILNRLATSDNYESSHLKRYKGELTDEQRCIGIKLLKLITVLQFTLPGIPSVYYGDEVGCEGGVDPYNRGYFPYGKENKEIFEHYKILGKIRKEHSVFSNGKFIPVSDILGCVAYKRQNKDETIIVVVNNNSHFIDYYLPENDYISLLGNKVEGNKIYLDGKSAFIGVKSEKGNI